MTEDEKAELYRLFGGQGPDIKARLGLPLGAVIDKAVREIVWDRYNYWAVRKARTVGAMGTLCDHALNCLRRILDVLEEKAND